MVEATVAKTRPMAERLELTGVVEPTRVAKMGSPAEGPIVACPVREGDHVRAGQLLARLGRARGDDAAASAARVELERERVELRRVERLVETGAIPAEELDAAKVKVSAARARFANAAEKLGDYRIVAPWDGVVSKVHVAVGDFVSARDTLIEVFDPESFVLRAAVPESASIRVSQATAVEVELDAHPGRRFRGEVIRLYPELDRRTFTRTIEVELEDEVALVPGMFARLKLTLSSAPEAIAVPIEAVLHREDAGPAVFVISEQAKAIRRQVKTGIEEPGLIQITAGLEAGEKVAVAGHGRLRDGMKVRRAGKAGKSPGGGEPRQEPRQAGEKRERQGEGRSASMRGLTDLAVRRKVATGAIALALVVFGLLSFVQLPIDFLPNIAYPLIKVHIWWRGATPEEIEEDVAEVVEREMASVEGLDYLSSSSLEGSYTLEVNFRYGVDVNVAFQDVQAAMARAARSLPDDMDPPVIIKADPQQLPVVQLTVRSSLWDQVELRDWAETWLLDRVVAVPGVSGAEIVGGLRREIRVHPDPLALERHGLSVTDLEQALADANVEMFAGRIDTGAQELIARTDGELSSLEEIRAVAVREEGLATVYLRDVAEVVDAHEEERVITRLDSEPCLRLSVQRQPDANTVEVARELAQRIDELTPTIPEHVSLGMMESQADYVEAALSSVTTSVWQAALLVVIVSLLFLGSFRQALVLIIALPVVLVINFALMRLGGFSINIFTLAGIVISLGVLLDSSIVVLENISRRREEGVSDRDSGAVGATTQVSGAVLAGTLTLLALFVPYLLASGITSLLFRELILTVAGVVAVGLVCSLTLVPMLGALLLGEPRAKSGAPRWQTLLLDGYERLVERGLRWRWLVLPLFAGVVASAVLLAPGLGSEFLPMIDDGRVMIKTRLPTGAALEQTDRLMARIEEELADDPLVESVFSLVGGKVWGLYTFEVANEGEIDIQLVPNRARISRRKGTSVSSRRV